MSHFLSHPWFWRHWQGMYWLPWTIVIIILLINDNVLEDKVSYSSLNLIIPNADGVDTLGCLPKSLLTFSLAQLCQGIRIPSAFWDIASLLPGGQRRNLIISLNQGWQSQPLCQWYIRNGHVTQFCFMRTKGKLPGNFLGELSLFLKRNQRQTFSFKPVNVEICMWCLGTVAAILSLEKI